MVERAKRSRPLAPLPLPPLVPESRAPAHCLDRSGACDPARQLASTPPAAPRSRHVGADTRTWALRSGRRPSCRSLARSHHDFRQLSTKAASTIHGRFIGPAAGARSRRQRSPMSTDEQFRSVGVSRQKALYLRDLAGKVNSREVTLEGLEDSGRRVGHCRVDDRERHRAVDGRDVPDVPAASAGCAPRRRSRDRCRGAESLRPSQAPDAGSPAEARATPGSRIAPLPAGICGEASTIRARSRRPPVRSDRGNAANEADVLLRRGPRSCCRDRRGAATHHRTNHATERLGRRWRARPGDKAGVRHVGRDVDERGRESRRQAHRLRSARRHLHDADRWHRRCARDAADDRSRLRHAAALQSRRQAHRDLQRSRWPVEYLDD